MRKPAARGAFKIRGALNFLMALTEAERKRGVVAFSSGNHAQAVAIAADHLKIAATIVMPLDTPNQNSSHSIVRAEDHFVRPPEGGSRGSSAAGGRRNQRGCIASVRSSLGCSRSRNSCLELLTEQPGLDALFVPAGGGGLLAGSAVAAKAHNPQIRVFGVEPELPAIGPIAQSGQRVAIPPPLTIADGLRTPSPGEVTFPIVSELVEEVLLVSEDEIKAAVRFLLSRLKLLTEPSGAVPAAALLHKKIPTAYARLASYCRGAMWI